MKLCDQCHRPFKTRPNRPAKYCSHACHGAAKQVRTMSGRADGKKLCRRCGVRKDLTEFNRHKGTVDERTTACKPCMVVANKKARKADPERWAVYSWRARIKGLYGINEKAYLDMLATQSGGCAICGRVTASETGRQKRLHVDHCHLTKKLRGLLCNFCNRGLALFLDNPARLRRAALYLEEHSHGKEEAVQTAA